MITEFFEFDGCAAVRIYYKDKNHTAYGPKDSKEILKPYGNYNVTGLSCFEAFTPIFMTGNVEVGYIYETYTDIPFEKITK